jgi:hypothetical protein
VENQNVQGTAYTIAILSTTNLAQAAFGVERRF